MSVPFTSYAQHENQTIKVTTTAELDAALQTLEAGGGGTILLDGTAGPYELTAIGLTETAPILIRAVDADIPPVIQKVTIQDSAYLTVTEARIDRSETYAQDPEVERDITVSGSDHIEFVGNQMVGIADGYLSADSGATEGRSLALVRSSSHVVFAENEISDYFHGVTFREVSDSVFTANEVTRMQGDGFRGVGIQNVQITDNHMHDFYGTTQDLNHSDMIQIWTNGAQSVTSDVTISGNFLDAGTGVATQSILIGTTSTDQTGPAAANPQNIVISDNVIHNGAANGIRTGHVDGLQILNNTLLWNAAVGTQQTVNDPVISREPGITAYGAADTVISGNIASRITVDGAPQQADNFILSYSDRNDPNYVHDHIVNLSGNGDLDLRDLRLKTDSAADGEYGAALSWNDTAETAEATIVTEEIFSNRQALILSGSQSLTVGDADQATYTWTFGDGTQLTGSEVVALFAVPGTYAVTLRVEGADGAADTVTRLVDVRSNDIVSLDFDNGVSDMSDWGAKIGYQGADSTVLTGGVDGNGFRMTGSTFIQIDRSNTQLFDLDSFSLELDYRPASAQEYGTLMRLPGTMELFVTASGALRFRLTTDQGTFEVMTDAGAMYTTDWTAIGVSYDGAAGRLQLLLDDQVVATTDAAGTTASPGHYHLYLGNPWSESARGVIDNFEMTTEPVGGWNDTILNTPIDGSISAVPVDGTPIDDGSILHGEDPGGQTDGASLLAASDAGAQIALGQDSFGIPRDAGFLFNRDDFRIELQLETAAAGQDGVFLHLHESLVAEVDAQGHVRFTLTTSDGTFALRSDVPLYSDAAVHDLSFTYDAAAGLLQITADGVVVAQTAASGVTGDASYWGLVLGHAWQDPLEATVQDFRFYGDVFIDMSQTGTDPVAELDWQAETLLTFEGTIHDVIDSTTEFRDLPADPQYVAGPDGQAYRLTGQNSIDFGRGEVALNDSDSFVFSFDFQRDDAQASGRVMYLHEVMDTYIDDTGFLHFELVTDAGEYHLVSDTAAFADTGWHSVEVAYDDASASLSLQIDDQVTAAVQASGTTAQSSYWGVTIGSSWGESITGNIDNVAFGDQFDVPMGDLLA